MLNNWQFSIQLCQIKSLIKRRVQKLNLLFGIFQLKPIPDRTPTNNSIPDDILLFSHFDPRTITVYRNSLIPFDYLTFIGRILQGQTMLFAFLKGPTNIILTKVIYVIIRHRKRMQFRQRIRSSLTTFRNKTNDLFPSPLSPKCAPVNRCLIALFSAATRFN